MIEYAGSGHLEPVALLPLAQARKHRVHVLEAPAHVLLPGLLAQQQVLLGHVEQARANLDEAINANRDCVRANVMLGDLEAAAGNPAAALSAWRSQTFRWESFSQTADLVRHLVGGVLMGLGGVMALVLVGAIAGPAAWIRRCMRSMWSSARPTAAGAPCEAPVALTAGPLPAEPGDVLINLGAAVPA